MATDVYGGPFSSSKNRYLKYQCEKIHKIFCGESYSQKMKKNFHQEVFIFNKNCFTDKLFKLIRITFKKPSRLQPSLPEKEVILLV